jgi:hypothetical protein
MPKYIDTELALKMKDEDRMIWAYDLTDLEEFLAGVPSADVVPRAEVERIFAEILNIIRGYSWSACVAKNNYGITQAEYIGTDILKFKKKYTEEQ